MTSQYKRERGIEQEKAQAILAHLDRAEEFDPSGNYFLAWDADGREFLTCWGDDEPTAENTEATSWASPGFPLPRRER